MVQEDYVSEEIMNLLLEKDYWQDCDAYYIPTQAQVMKWLREEYNIFIHISITQGSMYDSINELVFGEPEYRYKIERLYSYDEIYSRESYDSYKETIDAAIKYVLKNLI